MDKALALRLNARSEFYDSELYMRLGTLARDYVQSGLQCANYYYPEFDAAYDLADALAALPSGTTETQFDKLDRSNSRAFSHPAGATQIDVLATAISQILFGGETNTRVEAQRDEDEPKADAMNQILGWNDRQNQSYVNGFLWVKDCLICRGIRYNYWSTTYETKKEPVEYELPSPKKGGKPEKVTRFRTVKRKTGGYNKIVNISPYDFISDPTIPLSRFQESRYAGHRVIFTWQELKRRSELPIDDYEYVFPEVVKKLKNQKARRGITAISPGTSLMSTSRSFWERRRRGNPTPDVAINDKINREDGGTVECFCITIRCKPKNFKIYEDEEDELIEFLLAGETDLLSVNVMTNEHGEFPYAVGEGRPNAHQQYGPSLALLLKATQDMMDQLKGAHAEQTERSGIMFLADGTKCDIEQVLTDKTRIRQAILRTVEGLGVPADQIITQIPITDTTANFVEEIQYWDGVMQMTSGALPGVQGKTEDPGQTLGQYQDTAQMAAGRISTMARNLSSRALQPETKQIAMNFQQWMTDVQTIRILGNTSDDYDPENPPPKYMTVRREPWEPTEEEKAQIEQMNQKYEQACQQATSQGLPTPTMPPELLRANATDIQFGFDLTQHDGAMPGVDARSVAAASRLVEAAANPAFQQCFINTQAGNLDAKALLVYIAKKSGMPVKEFLITAETAKKNLAAQQQLAGGSPSQGNQPPPDPGMAGQAAPIGPPAPQTPLGAAAQIPATPSAEPPQAQGASLHL